MLGGGSLMLINRKRIAGLAIKSRLPSMYFTKKNTDAGGLMSYGRTVRTTIDASHISWTES